jgi:hypothetical protein
MRVQSFSSTMMLTCALSAALAQGGRGDPRGPIFEFDEPIEPIGTVGFNGIAVYPARMRRIALISISSPYRRRSSLRLSTANIAIRSANSLPSVPTCALTWINCS